MARAAGHHACIFGVSASNAKRTAHIMVRGRHARGTGLVSLLVLHVVPVPTGTRRPAAPHKPRHACALSCVLARWGDKLDGRPAELDGRLKTELSAGVDCVTPAAACAAAQPAHLFHRPGDSSVSAHQLTQCQGCGGPRSQGPKGCGCVKEALHERARRGGPQALREWEVINLVTLEHWQ
jgi:hypothetical protein